MNSEFEVSLVNIVESRLRRYVRVMEIRNEVIGVFVLRGKIELKYVENELRLKWGDEVGVRKV